MAEFVMGCLFQAADVAHPSAPRKPRRILPAVAKDISKLDWPRAGVGNQKIPRLGVYIMEASGQNYAIANPARSKSSPVSDASHELSTLPRERGTSRQSFA